MDCNIIEQQIVGLIDGQLSAEETKDIQKHINSYESCIALYKETKQLFLAYEDQEQLTPSDNLRKGFYELLEEEKQSVDTKFVNLAKEEKEFPWERAFQVAASIVLVFSGYFLGSHNTQQNTNQEISALQQQTV